VIVQAEDAAPLPDEELRLTLFRIAQESLRNVIDHAGAALVTITLRGANENLVLRICDDGSGFDTSAVAGPGLGLASIQERASQAGGRVRIESRSGGGTCIEVTVPVVDTEVSTTYQHGDPLASLVKGVSV